MIIASITIPVSAAHNRIDILGACLKSLVSQTYPREKQELVIIGDGCRVTREFLPPNISAKIFNFTHHAGLGAARNKGIEIASGDYIAFIDADCVAQEDWIMNLIKGIEEDNAAVCAGRILDPKNLCQNKKWVYAEGNYLPFTSLGNAIFRRDALKEIGFFDERFSRYMEDIDLCWRLCLKGYQIKYVPEAAVIHNENDSARKSFSKGIGARLIENKYRKLLHFPSLQELKKLKQIKNDFSLKGFKKYFFFSCGYFHALSKEWVRLFPKTEQTEVAEKFLQSASLLEPLNVELDGKKLVKPNYVVWWKSEGGIRILDVKRNREFVLQDISGKMWEYLMDGDSEEVILGKISDEHEVSGIELKADFEDFKEHLLKAKLLIYFYELNLAAAKIQSFIYEGKSMLPFLSPGDIILAEKTDHKKLWPGDIIVYQGPEKLIIHRFLYYKRTAGDIVCIAAKGDNSLGRDKPFESSRLIWRVLVINKRRGQIRLEFFSWKVISIFLALASLIEALVYENAQRCKRILFRKTKTSIFINKFLSKILKIPIFLVSKALVLPYR